MVEKFSLPRHNCKRCCRSLIRHCSFLQCAAIFVGFVCGDFFPTCSFIDEHVYPLLGEQGRSAVWGSRWCRWVRKCCFSPLMDCLTLSRYLCLCFFSCEVGGAILTLTSKALWNLGWSTWNCCHTTDQAERYFPFIWRNLPPSQAFPLFLPSISCGNFSCVKAVSPPAVLCEVENGLLPRIKFQIFSFYTVNTDGFKPPRIILSLVFSGTQDISYLKKMCLIIHKQGSNKYVASLNVLIPT